jgi:hypothetical protein
MTFDAWHLRFVTALKYVMYVARVDAVSDFMSHTILSSNMNTTSQLSTIPMCVHCGISQKEFYPFHVKPQPIGQKQVLRR